MVAASGNVIGSHFPQYGDDVWPASWSSYVISVGAVKEDGQWYNISNYFEELSVVAPGQNITSTKQSGGYYYPLNGTSGATPHVAGLAGLILSINPNLTASKVKTIINSTATDLGDHLKTGNGCINAYQALVLALAYDNKAAYAAPTSYNNQRILVRGINDSSNALHEVFFSGLYQGSWNGCEIFYRRSSDNGSNWDITKLLSVGDEGNRFPCLTVTDEGSEDGVHVVWQRKKDNGKYQVYYRKSLNSGSSRQDPDTLADDVTCSSYQKYGPNPVITSISSSPTDKLIAVWVTSGGLRYNIWYNGQWGSIFDLDDDSYNNKVWFPSIMGKGSWASLTYDTRYYGVYSRKFNGTNWTSKARVDQTSTSYDRKSQIAITPDDKTVAVWYARPNPYSGNYRICYREGDSSNGWSSQYEEFSHDNLHAYCPAVSYNPPQQQIGRAIVYYTNDKQVHLQMTEEAISNWEHHTLGSDNRCANITHVHSVTPKMIWSGDQSSSQGPYSIELSQQYLSKTTAANPVVYHRRADIENETDLTALCIEWGEIEVMTKTGETISLDFVPCDHRANLNLNATNLMDYLATEPTTLPTDVDKLQFYYQVYTNSQRDTLEKVVTEFNSFDVTFHITDISKKQSYTITETFSDVDGAIDFNQDVVVEAQNLAGSLIEMKPEITGVNLKGQQYSYLLGHIYIQKQEKLEKPSSPTIKTLKPEKFALLQNYPNPFNPETTIKYAVLIEGYVTLKIYNTLGQEIKTLVDDNVSAGSHTVQWDGRDRFCNAAASGIYILRLIAERKTVTGKMLLVR